MRWLRRNKAVSLRRWLVELLLAAAVLWTAVQAEHLAADPCAAQLPAVDSEAEIREPDELHVMAAEPGCLEGGRS